MWGFSVRRATERTCADIVDSFGEAVQPCGLLGYLISQGDKYVCVFVHIWGMVPLEFNFTALPKTCQIV